MIDKTAAILYGDSKEKGEIILSDFICFCIHSLVYTGIVFLLTARILESRKNPEAGKKNRILAVAGILWCGFYIVNYGMDALLFSTTVSAAQALIYWILIATTVILLVLMKKNLSSQNRPYDGLVD